MAYNAQTIIQQIQNKIGDTSFSPTDILQYINHRNREIHNMYQLRYMQASQDYTTSVGSNILGDLPSDFQTSYNLRRTDIQYAGKLNYINFDTYDERYPQPTLIAPSIPMIWTDFANQIILFPYPSQPANISAGYGMTLRYLKKPTTILTPSSVPDVPEEFQEVLTLGALQDAYERRQRFDVSQLEGQKYQAMLLELVSRYGIASMAKSEPHIMSSPIYGGRI